jgi:hypothetical protein
MIPYRYRSLPWSMECVSLGMKYLLCHFLRVFLISTYQVRTRAVSLQKYISSKEEILTHASKLLKAELPLSLRLMGKHLICP